MVNFFPYFLTDDYPNRNATVQVDSWVQQHRRATLLRACLCAPNGSHSVERANALVDGSPSAAGASRRMSSRWALNMSPLHSTREYAVINFKFQDDKMLTLLEHTEYFSL